MATAIAEQQNQAAIDPEVLQEFRELVGGNVILPGDETYDAARRVWNGMIDKRPELIVRARGVADIRQTVTFARENGLSLTIKGGGHNVAGHAVSDGGLTLDLGQMRAVWVDPVARTARVQGGALWADVDRETGAFGLATTGGVIASTGVAGLTLGGGIGWLVGKHGMTIDNLLAVDLVTAAGEFVTASATSHPDLFWALRGGGGNFGVATSFEFALHPQGDVLAGFVAWPIAQAREVLAFFRDYTATAPEELTVYAELVKDAESGDRVIALACCWPGDSAEGERVLAPLRTFGTPVAKMVELMPYPVWQQAFEDEFPHGRRYYWKSVLLRDLPDEVLDAAVTYGTNPPAPWSAAVFEFYRGPMNRVDPAATAFAHRDAHYQFIAVSASDDPADDARGIAWARHLHAKAEPYALNGAFLNFNSADAVERRDRVRTGYGENWERLVAVKRRYDPTNVFHENNNIVP
ncbi:MAG: FAD-binding oxidoreductase [Chloroflexia bacterium]|nr:FAD-binding oxidoreductase [Chloroflexia bacterium]